MRLGVGGGVALFNGRDGEWQAEVAEAGKRGGALICRHQSRPLQMPPDLWLLFAPIKKARTDFIVEKAAEMGAARIVPVQTDFTNAERIRQDRLQAHGQRGHFDMALDIGLPVSRKTDRHIAHRITR